MGHGNAGLASNFMDLAHAKVRKGGAVALVLPVVVISGGSWTKARKLLDGEYTNITVITIATVGSTNRAFSADTGMAEALLIATRRPSDHLSELDALWVNLTRRPASGAEAVEIARAITSAPGDATGWVQVGEDRVGCYIRAPLQESGCAQIIEPDVAATAFALGSATLRFSRIAPIDLPMVKLGDLGSPGLVDRDINGWQSDGSPRGSFDIHNLPSGQAASYPVLWAHDHTRERRLMVEPDSQGSGASGL